MGDHRPPTTGQSYNDKSQKQLGAGVETDRIMEQNGGTRNQPTKLWPTSFWVLLLLLLLFWFFCFVRNVSKTCSRKSIAYSINGAGKIGYLLNEE